MLAERIRRRIGFAEFGDVQEYLDTSGSEHLLSSHLASYLSVLRNGNSRLPDVRLYKSLRKITGSAFVNSAFVPEYCREGERVRRVIEI